MAQDFDPLIRSAAFNFLAEHTRLRGETFERATLSEGFLFRGQQVRLVGPQGIFKPAILDDRALSLTTVAPKRGRLAYPSGLALQICPVSSTYSSEARAALVSS